MRKSVTVLALLFVVSAAKADVFTVNFTASGFGAGAPQDPLSGSFTYEAASATSPVTALDSVNLTIAGHAYTLGEVSVASPYLGVYTVIGGALNGVGVVGPGNDFGLAWNTATQAYVDFEYTVAGGGFYSTESYQSFSITPITTAAVPEPSSVALLLTLTAALILPRRRLRAKRRPSV
jgi:hypothetical protein